MPVLVLLIGLALGGSASFTAPAWSNSVQAVAPMAAARVYPKVPPRPEQIASLLATIETELRASTTPATALPALGHQQQVIYRRLGRQPQLAQAVRALLPHRWQGVFDYHIGARRALQAMNRSGIKPTTLPAWRIVDPEPADALLAHYRKAEAATGIAWQVLAAVNLVETVMGRLDGVSIANAQGPMQILPSTWAERGIGQGNIRNPHDAIQAAARYLVRRGGLRDIRQGLWGYNNSDHYGRAVLHYAALLRSDPLAFRGLYHWQVHLMTSAGDLWLPSGTHNQSRLPVQQHIQRFPYAAPPDSL